MSELTELLLYEASRAQLTQKVILPALRQKKVVICDRFYDSTLAYQGYGRGLDKKTIVYLNHIVTFGLSPYLTILIDVPVEVSFRRKDKKKRKEDRLEKEKIEFHKKIREGYLKIARRNKTRIKVIDGTDDVFSTWQKVKRVVDSYLLR